MDAKAEKPSVGYAVAVLGTGIMGSAMIGALARAGLSVVAYNRTQAKALALAGDSVSVAETPAAAAHRAQVVISCVRDDDASETVWFGRSGAAASMRAGSLALECSTLSVGYVDRWASRLAERGLRALDCPVTGSRGAAEQGTLTFFLGGRASEYHEAVPVLRALSSQQFWLGAAGRGMRFKMLYNQLGGTILVALAEALALGEAYGLDVRDVVSTLSQNVNGWSAAAATSKGPAMLSRQHEPVACSVQTMAKDLGYAELDAQRFELDLPAARVALEVLRTAAGRGLASLDMSAVAEVVLGQRE